MTAIPEWADPLVTGRNRVLTHTPLGAFADAAAAQRRGDSPYRMCLDGVWQFQLSDSPSRMPADFLAEQLGAANWIEMAVPSNWQLDERVADAPIYTNVPYPFRKTPPAPPEVNPTGWYRTAFKLPAGWAGRELFLHFESCDSACQVWVNGVEAGYSQDSKLPHEFNITSLVRPGDNWLAVMVPRYCDGFWLECQDYWHLSGIQRTVTLYSKPAAHLRDFVVRTSFDAEFRDAELLVVAYMNEVADLAAGYTVELSLFEADGRPVFERPARAAVALSSPMYADTLPEYTAARFQLPVAAPRRWTAETPYLYTLVLSLVNPAGEAVDFESCRVGFRQVEIRDGVLLVNGRRLVVRGVDSHEHHPVVGRAMSVADMRDEIVAMKQLNFNAIRTSHYPHHTAYYDLCDELGMYVIDEANLETHGVGALTSKDPLWMNAYMERAQRMALRDKNHPCVIGWSLGNESYYGPHHAAMAAWLRHYDPTRLVQYESGFPGPAVSDVMAPMYPKLDWVREVLADPGERRPMIMCEYAYSKGNALGNFNKYWELVDLLPRFQGGFIWDWRDKALVRQVDGRPEWAYGNEFDGGIGPDGFNYGAFENPQMCLNGVVNPDLTPKPGAWEVMKVQAPVAFLADSAALLAGKLTVWNKYLALDLSHLEIAWEVTADGEQVASGTVTPPEVPPGGKGTFELPLPKIESPSAGTEYWLNVAARQRAATAWCAAGQRVAWEQFRLPPAGGGGQAGRRGGGAGTLELEVAAATCTVTGAGFALRFDRRQGMLTSFRAGEVELLSRPLEHSFLRARTDNDYIIGNASSYWAAWRSVGLDRLITERLSCEAAKLADNLAVVRCVTRHAAAERQDGIVCTTTYTVAGDGELRVGNCVEVDLPVPTLPRIGMKAGLAPGLETLAWYGRGPHESYPDRQTSALVGQYQSTVDAQFFPFVDPGECGGHQQTRWLRLTDGQGRGVEIHGQPQLHFSALHYTIEDLVQAGHVYELKRTPDIQLNLDGFHLGLGGDTGWTLNVHPEFLLPPGTYRYAFAWRPLAAGR